MGLAESWRCWWLWAHTALLGMLLVDLPCPLPQAPVLCHPAFLQHSCLMTSHQPHTCTIMSSTRWRDLWVTVAVPHLCVIQTKGGGRSWVLHPVGLRWALRELAGEFGGV